MTSAVLAVLAVSCAAPAAERMRRERAPISSGGDEATMRSPIDAAPWACERVAAGAVVTGRGFEPTPGRLVDVRFDEDSSIPPALVIRIAPGEELVCRATIASACRSVEGGVPDMYGPWSHGPELLFLRDEDDRVVPAFRYQTQLVGWGPPTPTDDGWTEQVARCQEIREWIWIATPDGAALASTAVVGGGGGRSCGPWADVSVVDGLACFTREERDLPACEGGSTAIGCYGVSPGRLVPAEPSTAVDPPTHARHPWVDADALPFASPSLVAADVAEPVREALAQCVRPPGYVTARLLFTGDGHVERVELDADPELDEQSEQCVRGALRGMSTSPFYGRFAYTISSASWDEFARGRIR